MRVRITRRRRGEVDGVRLEGFKVGSVYEVPTALATYLVVTGSAVPAEVSGYPFLPFEARINVSPTTPAVVADRRMRRQRPRPNKS